MFVYEYPVFEKKRILKAEMMEGLRDFPHSLAGLYFGEYADGILAGCSIDWEEGRLRLEGGMLCYNRQLYIMENRTEIPTPQDNKLRYLKVHFWAPEKEPDKIRAIGRLSLEEEEPGEGELELCRFCLQSGARLRCRHMDFKDYGTQFNTVIRIHTSYSAKSAATMWQEMLYDFAGEMLESGHNSHPYDAPFLLACMNADRPVSRRMIEGYLLARSGRDLRKGTLADLYHALLDVLTDRQAYDGPPQSRKKVMIY